MDGKFVTSTNSKATFTASTYIDKSSTVNVSASAIKLSVSPESSSKDANCSFVFAYPKTAGIASLSTSCKSKTFCTISNNTFVWFSSFNTVFKNSFPSKPSKLSMP